MKKIRFITVLIVISLVCSIHVFANNTQNNQMTSNVLWGIISEQNCELIAERSKKYTQKQYSEKELDAIRNDAVPNTVIPYRSIPTKNIKQLEITSNISGCLLEPSDTQNFEIDYVGVKDTSLFTVNSNIIGDTLKISIEGKENIPFYISNTPNNLVNILRVKVPSQVLEKIIIKDTCGNTVVSQLPIPVNGSTINGMILAKSETFSSEYSLSCVNGDVYAIGKTVTGTIDLDTVNGDAVVIADNVAGNVSLSCVNGDVRLKADTVQQASLHCVNGDVHVKVKEITKTLKTDTVNGDISIELENKPTNLTFQPHIGKIADILVPSGWKKGYTIGNGDAKLAASCVNGSVELKVQGF